MYAFGNGLCHHWGIVGYTRALDYLLGVENLVLGVAPFLPLNAVAVEKSFVSVLDGRHVRHEHVETLLLCQYGCAGTTLAGSKYHYSIHIHFLFFYFQFFLLV